ncbi:MAG: aldo/keto reductase [Nitrososphaeraceae archaeon]
MIQRKFGWTGVDVPVIGQGTWMIDGDSETEARAIRTLRLGLDLGMSHIDTAEMYGDGHVEELVGQAIAGRRDEIFLVSKVLPSNASYEGTLKACKRSLKRLKTDWLDLYLLHWRGSYPLSETMRAMEKLVTEGLVKYIGVSNFDVEDLMEAEQALQTERIACNQVLYNLRDRGIERRLLPYCSKKRIAVVGYAPFGHGNFPSPLSREGKLLVEIGRRHNRTPKQVALNFLTRHPSIFTIPKTTRPERVKENSGGVGWQLIEDEVNVIDREFPVPPPGTPIGVI